VCGHIIFITILNVAGIFKIFLARILLINPIRPRFFISIRFNYAVMTLVLFYLNINALISGEYTIIPL